MAPTTYPLICPVESERNNMNDNKLTRRGFLHYSAGGVLALTALPGLPLRTWDGG
jgi:hypothetical protein